MQTSLVTFYNKCDGKVVCKPFRIDELGIFLEYLFHGSPLLVGNMWKIQHNGWAGHQLQSIHLDGKQQLAALRWQLSISHRLLYRRSSHSLCRSPTTRNHLQGTLLTCRVYSPQ